MRPFAMVSWPGFVGAVTGIAQNGVGISEKVWMTNDKKNIQELADKNQIPVKDNNPGMFDDIFEKMYGEYELDKLQKSDKFISSKPSNLIPSMLFKPVT